MAKLIVDGKEIEAQEGSNLLRTCLDNSIYIPNLCWLSEMRKPSASCRLCFVEVEGIPQPTTSCSVKIWDGMKVRTDTEWVRRLQRSAFRLLLSAHRIECRTCPSNKKCDLQNMARFLKAPLRPKRLEYLTHQERERQEHPFLEYVPDRCVLCGKCVFVCRNRNEYSLISFANRGFGTMIRFSDDHFPGSLPCDRCFACVEVCPVSAILVKETPGIAAVP